MKRIAIILAVVIASAVMVPVTAAAKSGKTSTSIKSSYHAAAKIKHASVKKVSIKKVSIKKARIKRV